MTRVIAASALALSLLALASLALAHEGARYGIEIGAGIDEVSIGDTVEDVERAWGEPDLTSNGSLLIWWWFDTGLMVAFLSSEVFMMRAVVASGDIGTYWGATQEGLAIGDSQELALELYGEPEEVEDSYYSDEEHGEIFLGATWRYRTKGFSVSIDPSGKVDSITVTAPRVPESVEAGSWGRIKAAF